MTRLTEVLNRGRRPGYHGKFTNYKEVFPYKMPLPPILKDSVSNKKDKSKAAPCLEEIGLLLTCWKSSDFSMKGCEKEVKAFNKCYAASTNQPPQTGNKLSAAEVNKLLKKFPQPPHSYK
ncbi:coiled-coil-helix-coiled-coil-helix domain-containing protein 1 [Octopus bimaculoides]|uniref:CHCH domain-containing protein n=1 Tax=Octopus bimaculoides TaxID=37653 RepID=A0A0L8HTD8_OCTBM|nr:coiled-coil-helix-coiled-coil-helix domain-containing protein 1 [Octopus bimaculoides]|eukprot:XP_014769580.1 PREDICTED: coiled-coil-helix-coiled-coil-helix domain-containing protein 1-like [Octopus bimaculoides]